MKPFHVIVVLIISLGLWACAPARVAPPPASVPAPPMEKSAASFFSDAEALLESGHTDAAIVAFRAFLGRYPNDPMASAALMKIGLAHRANGDGAGAQKAYETLVAIYPQSPLAPEARVALLVGDYDDGRFEDLMNRVPRVLAANLSEDQRLKVHALAGDAAMALDRPRAAAEHYIAAWTAAGDDDRQMIDEKLVAALRLMDAAHMPALLAQIEDRQLRERIAELARELTFDRTTIGCLLPLSGPYEAIGHRALRGIELALNRFAETTGDPMAPTVRVADTAADSGRAKAAVAALAADGVAAILGPIATAEDAAGQAQAFQVPMITLTQKEGVADVGDFVFRNFITPPMQVDSLVSYATGVLGLKRFAILYPDEPYGTTFMNLFWDRVIEAGAEVVGAESYGGDQTDFAAPIDKLVGLFYPVPDDLKDQPVVVTPMTDAAHVDFDLLFGHSLTGFGGIYYRLPETLPVPPGFGPDGETETSPRPHREENKPDPIIDFDAVFIPDSPKKAGLVVPQLAYSDVTGVQLLGTNLWHAPSLMEMTREYVQGALFPVGFNPDSELPEIRSFVTRFHEVYGEPPGFIEAAAYDNMRILLELLAHPAVRSRAGLRDALAQLSHYPGVTGLTAFGSHGEALKKLFLMRIQGRKFVEVDFPQDGVTGETRFAPGDVGTIESLP
ncbi:MAG: ABC transporter substrate-binding protein [Desulfobacterales bacterium]|nr:ABC transporter substrate-binding protein [Desulfobacterales bacterium]